MQEEGEKKRQRAYFLELENKELKKRMEKLNKKAQQPSNILAANN